MRPYLRPTAPIAPDALLPGDPKRAMELAKALIGKPVMSNLSRGLWGYHGRHDGRELTVQSTGIGGPSAAVVLTELAGLGVRRAIRVGTCVALDPALEAGDVIVVDGAVAGDGVGSSLEPRGPIPPDQGLTAALSAATGVGQAALVASTDLYYDVGAGRRRAWRAAGAAVLDLSSAAILAVGRRSGVATACALVVAESVGADRLDDDALDAGAVALGERAAAALAVGQPASPAALP
jgi:uridine phosphorylase